MAKQELKPVAKSDSVSTAVGKEQLRKLDQEMMKNIESKTIGEIKTLLSNKDQSNPGKPSGGFSYKLKND